MCELVHARIRDIRGKRHVFLLSYVLSIAACYPPSSGHQFMSSGSNFTLTLIRSRLEINIDTRFAVITSEVARACK